MNTIVTRKRHVGALALILATLVLASVWLWQSTASAQSVTEQDDPIVITGPSSVSVAENDDKYNIVASYTATGGAEDEKLSWNKVSGDDSSAFRVMTVGPLANLNNPGKLRFSPPPDYENPTDSDKDNVYTVTIRASRGEWPHRASSSATLEVTVTVTDVNEAPVPIGMDLTPSGDSTLTEGSTETRTVRL